MESGILGYSKPFRAEQFAPKDALTILSVGTLAEATEPQSIATASVRVLGNQARNFEPFAALSNQDLPSISKKSLVRNTSENARRYLPQGGIGLATPLNQRPSGVSSRALDSPWIEDALQELDRVDQEAEEEGFPPRSESSKMNARKILLALKAWPFPASAIYPTQDDEVAILFQKPAAKSAVLILCDSDGGGACFSTIAGKKRRIRYDDANDPPDAFLRQELIRLGAALES